MRLLRPKFTPFHAICLLAVVGFAVMWKFQAPVPHKSSKKRIAQKLAKPKIENSVAPSAHGYSKELAAMCVRLPPKEEFGPAAYPPPPETLIVKKADVGKKVARVKRRVKVSKIQIENSLRLAALVEQQVEENFATDAVEELVEITGPEQTAYSSGFMEAPLAPHFDFASGVLLVQLDNKELDKALPLEQRLTASVGRLSDSDFSAATDRLAALTLTDEELTSDATAPEEKGYQIDLAPKPEPVLVAQQQPEATDVQTTSDTRDEPQVEPVKAPEPVIESPQEVEFEEEVVAEKPKPKVPLKLSPMIAAPADVSPEVAPPSPALVVPPTPAAPNKFEYSKPQPEPTTQGPPTEALTTEIEGVLHLDRELADWLSSKNGHVELYLEESTRHNPNDTIFLTREQYMYPARDFSIDVRGFQGSYQLVAAFHADGESAVLGYAPYSKILSKENEKEKIVFAIKRSDLKGQKDSYGPKEKPLTLTVFEGAAGNYRHPKAVSGARVSVVGFPQWIQTADAEGTVRFSQVPAESELIIAASAPGYFSSRTVVPVTAAGGYAPVFLVARDKVDTITRFFTKRPQDPAKGVVLGRIFDPDTRTPKQGESVELTGRKGKALYINALPDLSLKETAPTGLFAFFNVLPSYRALKRQASPFSLLFNVRPDEAQYIEWGRGGKRKLLGSIEDPFEKGRVAAQVSIVGDAQSRTVTDAIGRFAFDNIQFPPSAITLEVNAEGYPVTWHTLPWSARMPEKDRRLMVFSGDLLREFRKNARMKREKNTGIVVGGVDDKHFKGESCIFAELLTSAGSPMESAHGPFALWDGGIQKNEKLCLLKEKQGFSFFNLSPGEYLLNLRSEKNQLVTSRLIRVGMNRVSVAVN